MYHTYSITDLDRYAEQHNGHCLATNYVNCYTKYTFRCEAGHLFKLRWNNVRNRKYFCYKCENERRNTEHFKKIHEYAASREGVCLSPKYVGSNRKYRFRCKHGHEWMIYWHNMKYHQSWCAECDLLKTKAKRLSPTAKIIMNLPTQINSKTACQMIQCRPATQLALKKAPQGYEEPITKTVKEIEKRLFKLKTNRRHNVVAALAVYLATPYPLGDVTLLFETTGPTVASLSQLVFRRTPSAAKAELGVSTDVAWAQKQQGVCSK